MVIGVEGNVHVGKTTFIKNKYITDDNLILKETEFKKELSDFDRQLYYINAEVEKIRNSNLKGNIILDRTMISTYIYILYSNIFSKQEKKYFTDKIIKHITLNQILIPDIINFIIYPYDLICINQKKLCEIKGTQNFLVDYEYYINYNLFFANYISKINKIVETKDFRQVIEYPGIEIFNDIGKPTKKINSKVLLDGAPAIGKTTIGIKQKKHKYIKEFKYKSYSLDNYSNQLNSIIDRIKLLNKNNIIADTSFLMGITHLFYNNKTSQKLKLKLLEEIMNNIPLCLYTTKIIYLIAPQDILYERKNNDKTKPRNHFESNIKYLKQEINFYTKINEKLGGKSNINILDASSSDIDKIINDIYNSKEKVLLLVDLFYSIKELVESGDI